MRHKGLFKIFLTVALFSSISTMGFAADVPSPDGASGNSNENPPGRVARLQYLTGEVSMQPDGVNDWAAAPLNRPFTTADRIWADKSARAELSVGSGAIRIDSQTSLTFTNINDSNVQLQLDQGALSVTVYRLFPGEIYEIDTPNCAFTIMKAGEYRFDVDPNSDQTWVTVRKGSGVATGDGRSVKVNAEERVHFQHGNTLQHGAEAFPPRDGFEDWVKVRNQRLSNSESVRYVSPGMVGVEDLDEYGYWTEVVPYGRIWRPRHVVVDWAPYRYGHWVWISPWGWTWVDDAPWGFAPFHYGRWVYYGGGWAWAPGPVGYARPIWAPAMVAWVGGPNWGVGMSFGVGGGVGWFPLGWGEPYRPWYHHNDRYIREVNITNTRITNINIIHDDHYRFGNRNVPGAVSAVSRDSMMHGHMQSRDFVRVSPEAMRHAEVTRNINVNPSHEAMLGGPRTRDVAPQATRPAVTRMTPPARSHSVPEMSNHGESGVVTRPNSRNMESNAATPSTGRSVPRPSERSNMSPATASPSSSAPTVRSNATTNEGSSKSVPRPSSNYQYHPAPAVDGRSNASETRGGATDRSNGSGDTRNRSIEMRGNAVENRGSVETRSNAGEVHSNARPSTVTPRASEGASSPTSGGSERTTRSVERSEPASRNTGNNGRGEARSQSSGGGRQGHEGGGSNEGGHERNK